MNQPSDTSLSNEVKPRKDQALKIRLDSFIKARGLSISDFYREVGISRQLWYYYSWGLWPVPVQVRVRVAIVLKVDSSVLWPPEKRGASS